jgi:hypothetical protein
MLTISEYEEIAQRLDDSNKNLALVVDALSTPENLDKLRAQVEQKCDRMTVRARIVKAQDTQDQPSNPNVVIDIYKIELTDTNKRGYLLLKHAKGKLYDLITSENYIVDRIKLIINKKGEIVLISTSLTSKSFPYLIYDIVFRAESDETFEVESLELSQREERSNRYE